MSKDYYSILGVAKGASADELKKAFLKLAHQHHPDKPGGNAEKFKEINEAYQTLSDSGKRAQYDQFSAGGGSAFGGGSWDGGGFGGASGFNWQDFSGQGFNSNVQFDMGDLGEMFNGMFGGSARGGQGRRVSQRGEDLSLNLNLSFKEAIFGIKKKIDLQLQLPCEHCFGTGGEPNSVLKTCTGCNGKGQKVTVRKTFLGSMQSVAICEECQGEGKSYDKKCTHCAGAGRKSGSKQIELDIPAGVEDGMTLKVSGQGNIGKKGLQPGDLYVNLKVDEDQHLSREGANIFSLEEIPFSVAVLGGKVDIETVHGIKKVNIEAGTPSGYEMILKGEGAPKFQKHGHGDHVVTLVVNVPDNLNKEQKQAMEKLGDLGM